MTIGEAMRAARLARGLTQAELSERLGVGRTQLVNVERGRFTPSLFTLQEVADACRVRFACGDARWSWRRL